MPLLNSKARYTALSNDDLQESSYEKHEGEDTGLIFRPQRWWQRYLWFIHLFLAVLWTLGFTALVSQGTSYAEHRNPDADSPLVSTLAYSPKSFAAGVDGDNTKYQGPPNDANTAAWNRLTNTGIVALTTEEQRRLHDDSAVFDTNSKGETTYLGAIEVFHQIHCLDMLRLEIYGTLTDWLHEHHSMKDKMEHLDHCVDFLRQSLMSSEH